MLEELFNTDVAEVDEETLDEAGTSGRVVLHVLNDQALLRWLRDLLVAGNPRDGSFSIEAHKVFYLDEGELRYTWILVFWGELSDAVRESLAPVLSRRAPRPPPFALGRASKSSPAKAPAPSPPVRMSPEPLEEGEGDTAPGGSLRLGLKRGGKHNILKVEYKARNRGTTTTVALAHPGSLFLREVDPSKTIKLSSDRRGPRAFVQDCAEEDGFSPNRGTL